jgi:hypothetical protein
MRELTPAEQAERDRQIEERRRIANWMWLNTKSPGKNQTLDDKIPWLQAINLNRKHLTYVGIGALFALGLGFFYESSQSFSKAKNSYLARADNLSECIQSANTILYKFPDHPIKADRIKWEEEYNQLNKNLQVIAARNNEFNGWFYFLGGAGSLSGGFYLVALSSNEKKKPLSEEETTSEAN